MQLCLEGMVILTQLWLPLQVPPFFSPLVLVCVVFLLLVCRLVHRMTLKNSFAADIEKENGSVEMGHIPSLKAGWNGTGLLSPSSKLSPSSSGRMNFQISKTLSNTVYSLALSNKHISMLCKFILMLGLSSSCFLFISKSFALHTPVNADVGSDSRSYSYSYFIPVTTG